MSAPSVSSALFQPLYLGPLTLSHRVAMAPLTRFRANDLHEHTELAIEYYTQRCDTPGTLIITEATFISAAAGGYPNVPMCSTSTQIAAWKRIVSAVHSKGCFIYLQLWALGRAANPEILKKEGGADTSAVSAGDIPFEGGATPRMLTIEEIEMYKKDFAQCARNFVQGAGGDGVEVHGANGYLLDQFLQTNSNNRTDIYGGLLANRVRFPLEVMAAVVDAVGAERVGIRLSPYSTFQGMKMDSDLEIHSTFSTFTTLLKSAHPTLAYLHVVESRIKGNDDILGTESEMINFLYDIWTPGVFLAAGGFDAESALKEVEGRRNTVVVFGRWFLSNPDLVKRIKHGIPLTKYNRDTFYLYGHHPEGYTDYLVAKELVGKA